MGLFGGGKTCCVCGKKAGLLTRVSLKDGGYLCSECQNRLSDQLDADAYLMMTKADYERNIEAAKENDRKYKEEFHETFSVSMGGNKCFSADETHGWFVSPKYTRPVLISFDQIRNWNVDLKSEFDTDVDEENPSLIDGIDKLSEHARMSRFMDFILQSHPELPVCPPGCKITGMDLHIYVQHPMLREVVIDCFDVGLFSKPEDDMKNAYNTVIQITEFLQKVKGGAQAN